ncbi:MAG TPA: sarcosine oxidase subunit delta [Paracoccaceae bacterium]|nr:sarcosine oxidase subunit delta [Paracoccaceae bacterium]
MRIPCPLCGSRDLREFTPWGDAVLMERPDGMAPDARERFHDYVHIRGNPAGEHRELWFHEQGCRAWLVVTRDTVTHAVLGAALAAEARR